MDEECSCSLCVSRGTGASPLEAHLGPGSVAAEVTRARPDLPIHVCEQIARLVKDDRALAVLIARQWGSRT